MLYRIATALLWVLFASAPAIAAEPFPFARDVGDHGYIDGGDWACPSLNDEAEYNRLSRENDGVAAIKFEKHECVPLDDGTEVVVEKTEPWYYLDTHGYICVRPVGQLTNCGWVLLGSVTKVKCTKENWRQHPYCTAGHSITPYLHSPVDDPGG
jgi:hypothetical protein